jgi:hypothetical protein
MSRPNHARCKHCNRYRVLHPLMCRKCCDDPATFPPTAERPSSEGEIIVMPARARRGQALFHRQDARTA